MKTKLTALLTAGMLLVSAAALPPVQAEEQPSMESVIGTLPDWTPMNFDDAMQFYNTYGQSHVEDNMICLVRPILKQHRDWYTVELSGSMTLLNTPACTSPAVFEVEIPEQSDIAEYPTSEGLYAFEVQMFRVLEGEDLTITWMETSNGVDRVTDTFTFENPSGFIEQTDLYRWVPDCQTEYDTFLAKYGRACVYDDCIVYCAEICASTGASLSVTQSGDGAMEELFQSDCTQFMLEPLDGSNSYSVIVYEPTADGVVDVTWDIGQSWTDAPPFDSTFGRYEIRENGAAVTDLSDGCTVFTFVDKETGELIDVPEDASFRKDTIQEDYTSELFAIRSNPCIIDSMTAYDPQCSYAFDIRTEDGYYEAAEFEVTSEEELRIAVTCYLQYNTNPAPILPDGATRITLYDKDTGEMIPEAVVKLHNFTFGTSIGIKNDNVPGGMMYTGPFYTVDANPMLLTNDQLAYYYKYADSFAFTCEEQPEVTYYSNDSMDLAFRIKITASGNINGDDACSVVDAVALQQWLLGVADVEETAYFNWAEGDLDLNGKLNAFDLAILKKQLLAQQETYVEPDEELLYGAAMTVLQDGLPLYLGPDQSYPVVKAIPEGVVLYEKSYQQGNAYWVFTEYEGQFGWIRVFADDNETQTVYFDVAVDKPVIYLYPETETDVRVELELTESELSTTYPKYNNGWEVTAYPDGTLLNQADGSHHKYLFWDSVNCRTRYDFSKGFCVAGSDTEAFLKETLTAMGLTELEMNDFIVYWLPRMEHNPYNLITFQGDAYTDAAKLHITPEPDSLCRIFMVYVPLEEAVEIAPQELEPFARTGFTVVEWGGSEICR